MKPSLLYKSKTCAEVRRKLKPGVKARAASKVLYALYDYAFARGVAAASGVEVEVAAKAVGGGV